MLFAHDPVELHHGIESSPHALQRVGQELLLHGGCSACSVQHHTCYDPDQAALPRMPSSLKQGGRGILGGRAPRPAVQRQHSYALGPWPRVSLSVQGPVLICCIKPCLYLPSHPQACLLLHAHVHLMPHPSCVTAAAAATAAAAGRPHFFYFPCLPPFSAHCLRLC